MEKPSPTSPSLETKREAARAAAAEDAELVRRFVAGDEAAFTEIVLRHREKIYGVVHGFLRNHSDTEEIVQDTFIRAHRGLAKFRGDSSLATWLHHVAVNLARNRYWYFHRRKRHATLSLDCQLSDETDATFADLLPDPAAAPAHESMASEFTELVTVCMDKLPAAQREILAMRNLLHRSYDEIANELNIEVGTVKSRIARARGQLKALMTEACPEMNEEATPRDWFETSRSVQTI